LLEAILARDVYVVVGAVMLSAVLVIFANLFGDLLLYAVDPRIRRAA
jgi:peptide/nickel transport system permease protein